MTDLEHLLRRHGAPPEHGPGFEERLTAAIAADALPDEPVAGHAAARTAAARAAEQRAAGRARRSASPARAASPARRSGARLLAAVVAAAAVAALAVGAGIAVSRHTIPELRHPARASAAEVVAAKVRAAMGDVRTLQADSQEYFKLVTGPPKSQWRADWTTADWWAYAHIYSDKELKKLVAAGKYEGGPGSVKERIVIAADGRWRDFISQGRIGTREMVDQYTGDDATGVLKTYWSFDSTLYVTKATELGFPDRPDSEYGMSLWVDVGFIRPANLALMANGRVGTTTYEGRPCLTVSCAIAPVSIKGLDMRSHLFDTVRFTVDRRSWLVVRTAQLLRGQVVWQTSLSAIKLNAAVGDRQFEPSVPAGTKTKTVDLHYRRVTFAQAAHAFAEPALEPGVLPAGFHAFAAAVAPTSTFTYWTSVGYKRDYWPAARDVTQLDYRAGLLRFEVTTRVQPSGGALPTNLFAADPFVTEPAVDDQAATGKLETVTLSGGAWSGVTAYLTVPLLFEPHLWAWHDGRLLTVGGDLTRDELLGIANSLQPMS
jgi:hypothetical protein